MAGKRNRPNVKKSRMWRREDDIPFGDGTVAHFAESVRTAFLGDKSLFSAIQAALVILALCKRGAISPQHAIDESELSMQSGVQQMWVRALCRRIHLFGHVVVRLDPSPNAKYPENRYYLADNHELEQRAQWLQGQADYLLQDAAAARALKLEVTDSVIAERAKLEMDRAV